MWFFFFAGDRTLSDMGPNESFSALNFAETGNVALVLLSPSLNTHLSKKLT